MPRLLCLIVLLVAALPAHPQDRPPSPGLPPIAVGEAVRWPAIGRVNKGGFKSRELCTGTLIAPDVVLTAAHCTPKPDATPESLADRAFVAGYLRGDYIAVRGLAGGVRHPAYSGRLPSFDIGLLFLSRPIDNIRPLPLGRVERASVGVVGYHHKRPHMLSGRFDCPLMSLRLNVLQIDCPVIGGNSGGPVLQRDADGTWRVVGVIAATARGTAIAARVTAWIESEIERHRSETALPTSQ